jgi:type I restriction and modification enzyme subunit R-like protein
MVTDYVTGKPVPNIGSEENRQAIERYLVDKKGFDKKDIEVDAEIRLMIDGADYHSRVDLVVYTGEYRFMAIKSAAGSLDSWEREIVSAARLLDRYQLPISVVSDGKTAVVIDTVSGNKTGQGMQTIPSKEGAKEMMDSTPRLPVSEKRLRKEMLIFRSYDMMNVNVDRNL